MNKQITLKNSPLTEYLYTKASRKKIPLSGTFELSPICNFSCKMCYVRKTIKEVQEHSRNILTLEQWRRIAREAREAGMLYLLLTGGEPFLWTDFWTLYEELIEMGFLISINTNGSMIDMETVERLKKMPPRRVNITLYGAGDETYEALCGVRGMFPKVDEAIRSLKAAGINVKLNCSLTPHNQHDLEKLIDYATEKDLVLSVATYMFPPIRRDSSNIGINQRFTPEENAKYRLRCIELQNGQEKYQQYLEKICAGSVEPPGLDEGCLDPVNGSVRCRAGKASFWITWDGWMTPCGMMNEPKVDVTKQTFSDAWNMLAEETISLKLSGICNQCPNQQICHPCAAMAASETGSVEGIPKYLCESTREMRKIAMDAFGK